MTKQLITKIISFSIILYFTSYTLFFIYTRISFSRLTTENLYIYSSTLHYSNSWLVNLIEKSIFLILIGPLIEEFIFRFMLIKKLNYLKLSFLLMFVVFGISSIFSHFIKINDTFDTNLSTLTFNPLTYLIVAPCIVFLLYYLDIFLKKRGAAKTFITAAKEALNTTPIFIILFLNSIIFVSSHGALWQNEMAFNIIQFDRFIFSMCVSYLAYKYGLKLAILLHILTNFVVGMVTFSDLEFWTARVLYSTYGLIFILILTLIFQEIDRIRTLPKVNEQEILPHF